MSPLRLAVHWRLLEQVSNDLGIGRGWGDGVEKVHEMQRERGDQGEWSWRVDPFRVMRAQIDGWLRDVFQREVRPGR